MINTCWFCEEATTEKVFDVYVCKQCQEKNFDPKVGTGSFASEPEHWVKNADKTD